MSAPENLIRTIQQLSRCRELAEVVDVLRTSVRALSGADGITVVLREGDFCHYAEEDAVAPLWKGRRFPLETCISGWCMLHRSQVAIRDIYTDSRIPHDAYRPTFVKSLAMTPIRSEDPIGAIGAYWAREHEATDEELTLLQALGDSASVAIANAELIASLEIANRRKDEFLSVLAHELRNPLAPIWNAAQLMRMNNASEVSERAYLTIERQMQHMRRMVEDLVDTARVTRGTVDLRRERTDLSSLLNDTVEDWRATLEPLGLTLEIALPMTPVWVDADATRIAQVAGNLLDNARKFTPAGGRIQVGLAVDDARAEALIMVRDTGVGIDGAHLARIFEPLDQVDRSLDRKPGGLGLGLAIARGLVAMHGGTLHADSAGSGLGTTMTVRLPLADGAALTVMPATTTAARQHGRFRVLIVEDNHDCAETLRLYLEFKGFEVTVAGTGTDGVARALAERPDIVLCDIGLPLMDGYAVAQTLRADPATRSARLIAVTGYGNEEARARSMEAGFDLHLVKPIDLSRLTDHLALPIAS